MQRGAENVPDSPKTPALSAGDTAFDFAEALARDAGEGSKGERTRAQIRIAACRLLETMAPQQLTVALLCREAGIAHGTFYIYFSDRAVLVSELTRDFVHFVQQAMLRVGRKAAQQAGSGTGHEAVPDTIRATTAAYFSLFEQNRGLMRSLVHHLDGFPEVRDAFHTLNRQWIETVVSATARRFEREGRIGAVDHDELMRRAYALGGMTDQYLAGLLLSEDPNMQAVSRDREKVVDTLSLIWKRSLEP